MSKARKKSKPQKAKPKRWPKISRGPHGLSVIEAGAMIGLGRNAAYEAVKNGQIPVLEIGCRKIVPRGTWLKMIGATDAA
jgi:hypothetical protein